jgi:hypothetical protein
MKRLISTALAVALLVSLGALAVLARGGDEILSPADNVVVAAAQPQTAAAPDAPSTGGKWNMLGVPLVVSSITNAASLEAYIESNTTTTVGRLLKWDASLGASGGYRNWDPADEEASYNFPVGVGDAFWLLSVGSGTPVLSYVGNVPDQHSVTFGLVGSQPSCHYNMITVPLDKGTITNAAALASDIGLVSGVGVSAVGRLLSWNPTLNGVGGYYSYDPADEEASYNFDVGIGYPYWVCMKTNVTWPKWQ